MGVAADPPTATADAAAGAVRLLADGPDCMPRAAISLAHATAGAVQLPGRADVAGLSTGAGGTVAGNCFGGGGATGGPAGAAIGKDSGTPAGQPRAHATSCRTERSITVVVSTTNSVYSPLVAPRYPEDRMVLTRRDSDAREKDSAGAVCIGDECLAQETAGVATPADRPVGN